MPHMRMPAKIETAVKAALKRIMICHIFGSEKRDELADFEDSDSSGKRGFSGEEDEIEDSEERAVSDEAGG